MSVTHLPPLRTPSGSGHDLHAPHSLPPLAIANISPRRNGSTSAHKIQLPSFQALTAQCSDLPPLQAGSPRSASASTSSLFTKGLLHSGTPLTSTLPPLKVPSRPLDRESQARHREEHETIFDRKKPRTIDLVARSPRPSSASASSASPSDPYAFSYASRRHPAASHSASSLASSSASASAASETSEPPDEQPFYSSTSSSSSVYTPHQHPHAAPRIALPPISIGIGAQERYAPPSPPPGPGHMQARPRLTIPATPSWSQPSALTSPRPPSAHAHAAPHIAMGSPHAQYQAYPPGLSALGLSAPPKLKFNHAKAGGRTKKQALSCYFCRERKIACGRPDDPHGDQTCKCVFLVALALTFCADCLLLSAQPMRAPEDRVRVPDCVAPRAALAHPQCSAQVDGRLAGHAHDAAAARCDDDGQPAVTRSRCALPPTLCRDSPCIKSSRPDCIYQPTHVSIHSSPCNCIAAIPPRWYISREMSISVYLVSRSRSNTQRNWDRS
ncbi:unnamed protein product [Mycena citricolor]|uniref:Uncharacterized protein n=1 Tax=Mycena citricolor TaxID=2018698 RepID=A0AAD2HXM8_9AGAR|nr:unnamed protein product [Mycena citricolor]